MIKLLFLVGFLFAYSTVIAHASVAPDISLEQMTVEQVAVRLRPLKDASKGAGVSVAGSGLLVFSVPSESREPLIRTNGFDRLSFRYETGMKDGLWVVRDTATDQVLIRQPGRKIEIHGDSLRVDLRSAPSRIQLVASRDSRRGSARMPSLVGLLSIEDYLAGVVAAEVPRDWPLEALKAQAVAARSFAIAKVEERRRLRPDWLLEATVMDQVFDHDRIHPRALQAVQETRGEVMRASGHGRVIATHYHSDCGGKTDEPSVIWGGGPSLGTASCPVQPRTWRVVRSVQELGNELRSKALLPTGFVLAGLDVVERSSGGRALRIRAQGEDGTQASFSGEKLREAIGYSDLRSTLFEIKASEQGSKQESGGSRQVEFLGKGFGHGSGLCQWGARAFAIGGKTHREILEHYYPKLVLDRSVVSVAESKTSEQSLKR
jgi:stage II sporulation protein D